MNVKELKVYCTEKIGIADIELLQVFIQKQQRLLGETILRNVIIFLSLPLILSLALFILSGKFSLETLKNIIPFDLFFAFFLLIDILGIVIKSTRIAMKLKRAMKEGDGITVSGNHFLLDSRSVDYMGNGNGDTETSTFYHFSREDDSTVKFHVGSQQTGCYYDEMQERKKYKMFCLQGKYIIFVGIL